MQDPGWKEVAQRRASQFLTLISLRQRSDSYNTETAAASGAPLAPRQDVSSRHPHPSTAGQPGSISTSPSRVFQKVAPKNTEHPKQCLRPLKINHVENLAFTAQDDHLTESQTDAFRTVFEHFDRNRVDCIDAGTLSSTLESVGISITSGEVQAALKRADYDEDGMVGFHDFLSVMTDCQQFSKSMKVEGTDRVGVSERVFYKTLTELLNAGVLPRSAAEEIVQYYHKKTLRLIGQTARLGYDGGHVLSYYSKGAHLLGLTCKQLQKYLKPLGTNLAETSAHSPYLQHPSLRDDLAHTRLPPHHGLLMPVGRVKTTKTWKTVEIEDQIQKLSIKHPGTETKEMITPVQIRMNLALRERDRLTFDQVEQIVYKSQWALDQYLKTLAQYKRRDFWSSWGSLQSYCRRHRCKHFPQTFSTYSWSWSSCRNTVDVSELLHSEESPGPGLLHSQMTTRHGGRRKT